MAEPEIRVGRDLDEVAEIAASELFCALGSALSCRERASLALSGGSTPSPLYRQLAREPGPSIWDRIDVYLADERCVPSEDVASNYRLVRETLLVGLGEKAPRVHRILGELPARDAAAAYASVLGETLTGSPPILDAVVLGVGSDGHTASIFPGSGPGDGRSEVAWAVATRSPVAPHDRVSLSLGVLRAARLRVILATGASKSAVVGRVLGPDPDCELPVTWLAGASGRTVWVLDEAAASPVVA